MKVHKPQYQELHLPQDFYWKTDCSYYIPWNFQNSLLSGWLFLISQNQVFLSISYILAYDKFFNAKGVDDMKDLKDHYLSYFSAEQQKVITQEYGKDTKTFKKRQAAANGMKFSY